jgi:adenylylsulfate kinase-like enzyme
MSETAQFLAAVDRLALWMGRGFLIYLGLVIVWALIAGLRDAYESSRRPKQLRPERLRRLNILTPNARLVARAREQRPVYHREPDGTIVQLVGLDAIPEWPEDVR